MVVDEKFAAVCLLCLVHWLQAAATVMNKFKKAQAGEEKEIPVIAHYKQAEVEGKLYKLGDCVHIFVSFFPSLFLPQFVFVLVTAVRCLFL